jgi:hypothetical protein
MNKRLFSIAGAIVLSLATAGLALAQETKTTAVQNPDGTWTVIEYPVDKEVIVNLTPTTTIPGAVGTAKIHRMKDGTMINLDIKGVTGDATAFNLYAVDPTGKATLLGPVNVTNGTATISTTTPLNRFMLVLSPEADLTTVSPETNIVFRSVVPEGFAVIPLSTSGEKDGAAVGERVAATTTSGTSPAYTAPLLGIPGFRRGTDTEMKINFTGEMTGSRANVYIEPRKDGATTIRMRFHELKEAPGGKVYVLWAIAPDNTFHRLGSVVNTGVRNEAQIQTETHLGDFGLFVTAEDENSKTPTGIILGTVAK